METPNEAINFLCNKLKNNLDDWGKLNGKWINPLAAIMEGYYRSKVKNNGDIHPVSDSSVNESDTKLKVMTQMYNDLRDHEDKRNEKLNEVKRIIEELRMI